jgi:hypothetical protein
LTDRDSAWWRDTILRGYALGYILFKTGDYEEALTALKDVLQLCPNHFSAASLVIMLQLAGIRAKPLAGELAGFSAANAL